METNGKTAEEQVKDKTDGQATEVEGEVLSLDEIRRALIVYEEENRKVRAIKSRLEGLKPKIVAYINKRLDGRPLEWAGITATAIPKRYRTVNAKSVEQIFGIALTDECYKTTNSTELRVRRVD